MEYDLLVKLIPPAIALSALAYFVNFFGKVISDQQPFTDDRRWHIQIAGSMFVLDVISWSIVGIFLANTMPPRVDHWLEHVAIFSLLSIIGAVLYCNVKQDSSRLYKYNKKKIEAFNEKHEGVPALFAIIGQHIPPFFLIIVTSFLITLEYLSGNQYLLAIAAVFSFYIFLWLAYQFSLRKLEEIAFVDIYFTSSTVEPLRSVQLLKYNDDNIRVRVEDKILFLNKSEVHRVEMHIPEKSL